MLAYVIDMRVSISSRHSVRNRSVKRVWCSRQAGGLTTFSLILLLLLMTFSSAPIRPSRLFMPEPAEGTANQRKEDKLETCNKTQSQTLTNISVINSSCHQDMARNLLPCHFIYLFIFSTVIQGTARQHGLIH